MIETPNIRGLDELNKFLDELPRGTKISAMRAAGEYLLGDSRHGLKHNPPRRQHGENNPYQWQSEKQRRWWFANHGDEPYQRTGELSNGWTMQEKDSNYTTVYLENNRAYAGFVQGDELQTGHKVDGWRYYMDVIATNITGAINKAQKAVDEWIEKHNR